METYVILRRGAWRALGEQREAAARSTLAVERIGDDVSWIRSYVVEECDGRIGSLCVYRAASPEALRAHARQAGLPVDEIVLVADTVIVRDDPGTTIT